MPPCWILVTEYSEGLIGHYIFLLLAKIQAKAALSVDVYFSTTNSHFTLYQKKEPPLAPNVIYLVGEQPYWIHIVVELQMLQHDVKIILEGKVYI